MFIKKNAHTLNGVSATREVNVSAKEAGRSDLLTWPGR